MFPCTRAGAYNILLALAGLSIHFLYAAFFFSNALWHSSSKHHLLSGFGWYPIVFSAASIIICFIFFQSSSTWLFSSVNQVSKFFFHLLLEPPNHAAFFQCIYMEPSFCCIWFIFIVCYFASISPSN